MMERAAEPPALPAETMPSSLTEDVDSAAALALGLIGEATPATRYEKNLLSAAG